MSAGGLGGMRSNETNWLLNESFERVIDDQRRPRSSSILAIPIAVNLNRQNLNPTGTVVSSFS